MASNNSNPVSLPATPHSKNGRFGVRSPTETVSLMDDEPNRESSLVKYPHVPIVSVKSSTFGPVAAIGINLAVIGFLITINTTHIYIRHYGSMSSRAHAIYVTGVAILASLIASYTNGWVKVLMLKRAVPDLEKEEIPLETRKQAGVIVGLGGSRDQIRKWGISVSFIAVGLTTSAIVAAFTPTIVPVKQSLGGIADPGHVTDECLVVGQTNPADASFSWILENGSYLYVNETTNIRCEIQNVLPILQNYVSAASVEWAYTLNNVPVAQSAIGVACHLPWMDFTNPFGIDDNPTGQYYGSDAEFEWVTQCLPVLASNPVQCVESGFVVVGRNNVTVFSEDFNFTTPTYAVDPVFHGASSAGAWTSGFEVGEAVVLVGAVNEQANQLASIMTYNTSQNTSTSTYSAMCFIDIAPVVSYRMLNYSRAYDPLSSGYLSHTWQVSSNEFSPCSPSNQINPIPLSAWLTEEALAAGAAASVQLLKQGQYASGPIPDLFSIVQNVATLGGKVFPTDFQVFEDSKNPLEDVLGLASGIALGFYWGVVQQDSLTWDNGEASILGVKIGPSERWAIVYILPSVFSVVLLSWLVWTTGSIIKRTAKNNYRQ